MNMPTKAGTFCEWRKFSRWGIVSILLFFMGCENPVEVRTLGDITLGNRVIYTAPSFSFIEQAAEAPDGKGMAFYLTNDNGFRVISAVLNGDSSQVSPMLGIRAKVSLLGYSSLSHALIISQGRQLYKLNTSHYEVQPLPIEMDKFRRTIIGEIQFQGAMYDLLSIQPRDGSIVKFQLGNSQQVDSTTLVVQNNNLYNVASKVQSLTNIPGTDTLFLATKTHIYRWLLSISQEPDSVIIYQNLTSSQSIQAILAWNRCLLVTRLDSFFIYDLHTLELLSGQQLSNNSDYTITRLIGLDDNTVFGQLKSLQNYYLFSCPGGNAELETFSPDELSGPRSGNYGIDPATGTVYRLSGPFTYGYFDFVDLESGENPWSSRGLFSPPVKYLTWGDETSVIFVTEGKRSEMVMRYHFPTGRFDTLATSNYRFVFDLVRTTEGFVTISSMDRVLMKPMWVTVYNNQGEMQTEYRIDEKISALYFDPPSGKFFGITLDDYYDDYKIMEWEADNPAQIQIRKLPSQPKRVMLLPSGSVLRTKGNFWFGFIEGRSTYVTDYQWEHTVEVLRLKDPNSYREVLWSKDGRSLYYSIMSFLSEMIRKQIWLGP